MKRPGISDLVRPVLALLATAIVFVGPPPVLAGHPAQVTDETLTRYEQFILEGCSPCMKESVPIATLQVPAVRIGALPKAIAARTTRAGEIGVETLRAHMLGRPSRQLLAVRLILSMATGNPNETYRFASGIVDEEEVGAFVSGLAEIAQAAAATTAAKAEDDVVEIDLHNGSVRVGVLRLKGESVVFVQAGDVRVMTRRPVWDTPATLFLPLADLAKLRGAVGQAAETMRKLRVGQ